MRQVALPLILAALLVPFALNRGAGAQQTNSPTATPQLTVTTQPTATPQPTATSIQPPPPPPNPFSTPVTPPPAPGATATTSPTATAVPLTVVEKLAHGTVAPGKKQKVSITTMANASIQVVVHFPNGYLKRHRATASATGTASWSYKQPGSRITPHSNVAKVSVVVTAAGQTAHSSKRYHIAFGKVDLSISPHGQKPGESVTVWAHSYPNAPVTLTFSRKGHLIKTLPLRAGSSGWLEVRYVIPLHTAKGKIDVRASVPWGKSKATAHTSFSVK